MVEAIKYRSPSNMPFMKPSTLLIFFFLIIGFSGPILFPTHANTSEGWLYFSRDKHLSSTKYFYDFESVQYFPDNHVNVWMKVQNASREQCLHAEISCSSPLFRIIQPPSPDHWDVLYKKKPNKTQYVVSGWLEIPPDSEVTILRKILCNNPKKNLN